MFSNSPGETSACSAGALAPTLSFRQLMADYGRVLSVDDSTTTHGGTHMKNGMRFVRLEVVEAGRLSLPNLIRFACETSMLLTVPGRPLYALRGTEFGT